ncbi:MDIS1-interacting receptor like kinase 2-like [Ziziphus jujuba]|uniref:non-specific serine/threonine protein kinase n=1 Tax=Ziziphus jujuba TaxID=326968 RepID=A0A6P4A295_ZIZJJ|nr:MDIS1-interacting receptor like kinase 2-like [Ziziphus jujuba]XP_060671376.1 MDIS1-interacting receptor like kinase 2-like [Ziziphus jujuba]
MAVLGNNKGLCGNNTGLKPCPTNRRKGSNATLVLIILYIVCLIISLLIIVGIIFIYRMREAAVDEPTAAPIETYFATWNYEGENVHEEILKATQKFDSKYCIGVGGYGCVYKAQLPTGEVVAIKKFHKNDGILDGEEAFTTEINGSLADNLRDEVKALELGWRKRVNIVKGLANATCYMHYECCPAIIHRDILSKNVLLDDECEAHISDFGSATTLDPDSSN